jgi:hypothetical protein
MTSGVVFFSLVSGYLASILQNFEDVDEQQIE